MADISTFLFLRHLRSEPTSHLFLFKGGRLKRSGRGLAFWFVPLGSSIVEIPLDDREVPFTFGARTADFQDVNVQGVVTYRVRNPELLAERVDFTIDTVEGCHKENPLDRIALIITQLCQQIALSWLSKATLKEALAEGVEVLRDLIHHGLQDDEGFIEVGLQLVSTRVAAIKPNPEMERALEMPTRESIQQQADEAKFQRRAQAVEKERAIQENELQNRIELAQQEEQLIDQQGQNERRRATEETEAKRIQVEADAEQSLTRARAESEQTLIIARAAGERIKLVESSKNEAERERMEIYRDLPTPTLLGLAARRLAEKLQSIDHLNVTPELFGPILNRLIEAGTKKLEDAA